MRKGRVYIERLLKVAEAIEKDPKHFNMAAWVSRTDPRKMSEKVERAIAREQEAVYSGDGGLPYIKEVVRVLREEGKDGQPWCGSALCICGWAVYLHPEELERMGGKRRDWPEIGRSLLGLTNDEGDRLFSYTNWPLWARVEVRKLVQDPKRTKLAAAKVAAKVGGIILRMMAAGEDPWDQKWRDLYDKKGLKGVKV